MSQVEWERVRRDVLSLMSNGLSDRTDRTARSFVDFAQGSGSSIVPEPRIRSWLPERLAAPGWTSPMPWIPTDFWPYEFQARAFDRLSVSGQLPSPTVIAAPDGAGKSECFLLPMLDHCARQRGMSRPGIKALVVYASRASASENAARVASICRSVERFHDLRPGLLIDEYGSTSAGDSGSVADSMDSLVEHPPDLLLTVPEMLERSIMTKRLHGIWADTSPASLRFVVLDDIHLYTDDGIEDLSVLLRRLGVTLGMASPTQPLAGAVPVLTAGVHIEPLDLPSEGVGPSRSMDLTSLSSPDRPHGDLAGTETADGGSSFGRPGVPPVAGAPSSLPRPTVDVRKGASALPSLADTPTERPDADPSRLPFGSGRGASVGPPTDMPRLSPLGVADGDDDDQVSNPLLDLGHFLFGVRFGARSLVVGSTSTIDELQPHPTSGLPTPRLEDLAEVPIDDPVAIIAALFGPTTALPPDPVQLGQLLLTHPLVRSVVQETADQLTSAGDVVRALSGHREGYPSDAVARGVQGLQRVMAVLGASQRLVGTRRVPLIRIEAQIEVHRSGRLVRLVDSEPTFAVAHDVVLDDPSTIPPPRLRLAVEESHEEGQRHRRYLPAVACRNCGSSGWLAALLGNHRPRASMPSQIEAPLGQQGGNLAIMMLTEAHPTPGDRSVGLLDIDTLDLYFADQPDDEQPSKVFGSVTDTVAVELGTGTAAVSQRTCPVCDSHGSVDLLGVDDSEMMAEVTKSMTGAAHGSGGRDGRVLVLTTSSETVHEQLEGFTADRYADQLRRHVVTALDGSAEAGISIPLVDLAARIVDDARSSQSLEQVVPDDLGSDPRTLSLRTDQPSDDELATLTERTMFELATEFGHRAANADSLLTTGAIRLSIDANISDEVVDAIESKISAEADTIVDPATIRVYVSGLLEKLRANGAIRTPLLQQYIIEGGDPSFIGERRPIGLRELVGTDRPRFVTTAVTSTFDSVTAVHQRPGGARTWMVEWACSTLGVNSVDAPSVTWATLEILSEHGDVVFGVDSMDGHRVYGLRPEAIVVQLARTNQKSTGSDDSVSDLSGQRPPRHAPQLRTMSSVDASPLEKAQMEWQFKYGPPDTAPNVFYMSAGTLRSDRDVMDTSIDLATVDALIADVNAIGDLTGVPEVSRTGTRSGHGTVVWVGGPRRNGEAVTVDTEARLPDTPGSHRSNELDYLLFLFDRVADGTIAFDGSFETMDQAMAVAIEPPVRTHSPRPSVTSGVSVEGDDPEMMPVTPPSPPVSGGGPPRPGFGHRPPAQVPDAPRLDQSVSYVPAEFTNEGKALYEVLIASSKNDDGPIESFLRSVAIDQDDATRSLITKFARSGIGKTLDRIRSIWSENHESADPGVMVGDALRSMSSNPRQLTAPGLEMPDASTPPNLLDGAPTGAPARPAPTAAQAVGLPPPLPPPQHRVGWSIDTVPLGVHVGRTRIRVVLPILDIQGRSRAYSVAAVVADSVGQLTSSPVGSNLQVAVSLQPVVSNGQSRVDDGDATRGVWCLDLSGLDATDVDRFADSETIRDLFERARRTATKETIRPGGADLLRMTDGGSVRDRHRQLIVEGEPVAASSLLAIETIDRILDQWGEPTPFDQTGTVALDEMTGPLITTPALASLATQELSRGFELALDTWLQREPDVMGSLRPESGTGLELTMTFDGAERRYLMDQAGSHGVSTYRIRPLASDQPWPEVSVQLVDDSVDPTAATTAMHRRKEEGPSPNLSWILRWTDVAEFYTAAAAADAADVRDRDVLSSSERESISAQIQTLPTRIRMESLEQNPLALLLDILARPYREDWQLTADSILHVIGEQSGSTDLPRNSTEFAILKYHLDGLSRESVADGQ